MQRIEVEARPKEAHVKTVALTVLATLMLSSALAAGAQTPATGNPSPAPGPQGSTGPGRRTPPTPPPEAVAACSGKAVGASCTFQHKDRTETGSCFTPDPAQAVACKPVRPPREDGSATAR
jgi:hypothetical protein